MTTTFGTIPRNAKIRSGVVNLPTYFDCLDNAYCAVSKVLSAEGYSLAGVDWYDFTAESGSESIDISFHGADCNHCLVFSWYTMSSGRVELTAYIS